MQADATQRKLAERWTYYYHATRMSPAKLKAWLQAQERAHTSTETPAQVTAPVQPAEPSGQPGWLVISLGGLAAALALVAGLAVVAARRANRRARVGGRRPNHGHDSMGLPPTGSPIALDDTRPLGVSARASARA